MSNARNIGVAFEMYKADNDRYYPAPRVKDSWQMRWAAQILPYAGGGEPSTFDPNDPPEIFRCTEENAGFRMNSMGLNMGPTVCVGFGRAGLSQYHSYHWPEGEVDAMCQKAKCTLGETVLVFEGHWINGWTGSYMNFWTAHIGGSNVLAIDGTVEFWPVDTSDVYNQFGSYSFARTFWMDMYPNYYPRWLTPGYYYQP
jgi:hypothetical protein